MELDLASAIQEYTQSTINSTVFTACPARVVSVIDDLFGLQVNVQPMIQGYTDVTQTTPLAQPVIYGISVIMPSSSQSMLSFPIFAGDTVLLVFSHDNIDTFVTGTGKALSLPTDARTWSYMDCVAIPGWWPSANSPNNPARRQLAHSTGDVVLAHNIGTASEIEVRLTQSGHINLNAPAGQVNITTAAATINIPTQTVSGNIAQTGNNTITGSVIINGVDFSTHTHNVIAVGSPSGPPI